ncbi:MAG: hypothetical protein QM778_28560 [Myxococcales bacterium]
MKSRWLRASGLVFCVGMLGGCSCPGDEAKPASSDGSKPTASGPAAGGNAAGLRDTDDEAVERHKCTPKGHSVLDIGKHPQEARTWCWAAVGQTVMEYKSKRKFPQSLLASERYQATPEQCACKACQLDQPKPADCDVDPSCDKETGGLPPLKAKGFTFEPRASDNLLKPEEWKKQLSVAPCIDSPVVALRETSARGRHAVTVYGYETIGNELWLWVFDPAGAAGECCGSQTMLVHHTEFAKDDEFRTYEEYASIREEGSI